MIGQDDRAEVQMKLLVVEDEEGISSSLMKGLTADGFTVDVADNGLDGFHLARENEYAAIILDLMLPGLNGYRICAQLRDEGDTTPILMLTAKDGEFDEMEGLETGADDYVTKPFSYPILLARVKALIRRSATEASDRSEILEVGDVRLDPYAHRVWCRSEEIELSPRAIGVLEYLMHNAGNVVSKDDILRNVWDHAFDGDPNIVEVYISRIRAAIDSPFDRKMLRTVRGIGYRLTADGGRG